MPQMRIDMNAEKTLIDIGRVASDNRPSQPAVVLRTVAGRASSSPILIATMHGKEAVLAPALADLGFHVLLPDGYDTDALGTFSGDVRRPGTAVEAALEKARRACDVTGIPRAIASEGSYRPCQKSFPGARNAELLAFVDREAGVEFVECMTDVPTRLVQGRVRPDLDDPAVQALLGSMDWPATRAMVTPADPGLGVMPAHVYKGIDTAESLATALRSCAALSDDGCAHLETDLRAHMNPSRMASVALVGQRLCMRLQQEGYGVARRLAA